ncbi:MAG: hypothetical protein IKY83_03145 [Proteobacteria bacterium]|nr:hypothetical protein [Pseudomonadota bacterium]
MKKSLWILSALALAGFCMTGCLEGLESSPEAGDVVDNDKYCDGLCEAGEFCILSDDLETGECAECSKKCDEPGYPVCIILDGGVGEVCVATASCPEGQGYQYDEDLKHYLCSEGDPIVDPDPVEGAAQYIRVDDMSSQADACGEIKNGKCSKDDPGADLDAIVVRTAAGGYLYAKEVMGYSRGPEGQDRITERGVAADPSKVLGKPDSLLSYPDSGDCYYLKKDSVKDDYDFTFMSLGGEGGYVEVKMDDVFHAGDSVDIIELGNCELVNLHDSDNHITASKVGAEPMKVQVSVSGEDGTWKVLGASGSAKGGIFSAGTITSDMLK